MIAAMKWLVSGARAGDHLFLHYSGHGTQVDDTDGDEMDGKERLAPQFRHRTTEAWRRGGFSSSVARGSDLVVSDGEANGGDR